MIRKKDLQWTDFYMELADKILMYKSDRQSLILLLKSAYKEANINFTYTEESEIIGDICPFTFFGSFNKMIQVEKRIAVLKHLKLKMEIKAEVPTSLEGIPLLNNLKAWFFGYSQERNADDIDHLWEMFEDAILYADIPTEENKRKFITIYQKVRNQKGVKNILSLGLFWCRPYTYLSLDNKNRKFIMRENNISPYFVSILTEFDKKNPNGQQYLYLCEQCIEAIQDRQTFYCNIPELSYSSWKVSKDIEITATTEKEIKFKKYTKENFLEEVFLSEKQYEELLRLLQKKKNIIIQGAPGVGKTFAAKRLAYAIMGEKDRNRVRMVQFHQSYSYEDFMIGYRPVKEGFELSFGPFYEFCKKAQDDKKREYFFIIDEINRGNLSKIFGELLMLIETDKREESLQLLYSNELFKVPENVFIIGMMNTADRSLAMIDYALRRRFAFYELKPAFDSLNFQKIIEIANNSKFTLLINKVKELNKFIQTEESLGRGFVIGHSYFCVSKEVSEEDIYDLIHYELLPLIEEYWFDEQAKVEKWTDILCGVWNDKN